MKTIGIVTIHKINNFGSVLQAYALQTACEKMGFDARIIDYQFPNSFHKRNQIDACPAKTRLFNSFVKIRYGFDLLIQHRKMGKFVKSNLNLTKQYSEYSDLLANAPVFDFYITGSDQVWNPRYCYGDPAFFLEFAPEFGKRISYSSSFGVSEIPLEYHGAYAGYLRKYDYISVREKSGVRLINELINRDATLVLDPVFLIDKKQWLCFLTAKKSKNIGKYVLCYFLNYTFNAHPYVDRLADYVFSQTGYHLVMIGRPPVSNCLKNREYIINLSPFDFLRYLSDAEMVLTTSFHGTAFSLIFNVPFYSVILSKTDTDARLYDLLSTLDLESRVLQLHDPFPNKEDFPLSFDRPSVILDKLIAESMDFLKLSLGVS